MTDTGGVRTVAAAQASPAATEPADGVSLAEMSSLEPFDADEERALVEAVLARVPGAFERLVRAYQGLCWHIIGRMVRHPEDTRELCQEAFLRVHRYLDDYRFECRLKSWIGQVAYHVALRHLQRKRIPIAEPPGEGDADPLDSVGGDTDVEAACHDDEVAAALHDAIESLPPLQRTVLTLYHLHEMAIADIAEITGLPGGTIKSHLFRSRAKLRRRLRARIGVTT